MKLPWKRNNNPEPSSVIAAYEQKIAKLEAELGTATQRALDMEERAKRAELTRQIADDETKHLVKMRIEELELEHQRKEVDRELEMHKKVAEVQDEYQRKLEEELKAQLQRIQDMYGEVLARLPNIKLTGDVSPRG